MTPDPELISETRAWFKKAAHDIRVEKMGSPLTWDRILKGCIGV
jgi:hypothetical protein